MANVRDIPPRMADRLIVALDVPSIAQAERLVDQLAGTASFFKIGLWLAFAEGVDGLLRRLIDGGKRVFLDTKMYDIGQTVEEGVARAADRGVSFVTVHGDRRMLEAAVRGKRGSALRVFAVTVLTSLDDAALREMGYGFTASELVRRRSVEAARCGCDGIIASAHDDPDAIRTAAGDERLLIATPGIRPAGDAADDHARRATPAQAIARGADYLVVGRPIIARPDPREAAERIIAQMQTA